MTQKSERWIRPEFGSSLMNYTFMDTSATMLNVMARDVASDLMSQEPRLADVNVRIDSSSKPGCLIIYIDYLVRQTNVRDNLVFPFYLDTTWEDTEETDGEEIMSI